MTPHPPSGEQTPDQSLRICQIVTIALAAGMLAFGGMVATIGPLDRPNVPTLTYVLLAAAGLAVAARIVVVPAAARSAAMAQGRRQTHLSSSSAPVASFMIQHFVAAATLEGPAFMCLIAYLLEGQAVALVVAACLLAMLLGSFPTRAKFRRHLERFAEELGE